MTTALITGATLGIGQEFAWQLASTNHDLVLVGRNEEKLAEMAHQLRQVAGVQAEYLVADLADEAARQRVVERLGSADQPVDLLVNNAGFGIGKPFLEADLDTELGGLEVMVKALMILTRAGAEAMVGRGRGAIINISSIASGTGMGTYLAHKAWVKAFSEGLAEQLRGTGVSVTAVMPGLTRTDFHRRAGIESTAPDLSWLSAEQVVTEALAAARRAQVLVTPSLRYKAVGQVMQHAPRWAVRAVTRRLPHM